ncbi:MAG: HAMP domain-containing sensor histidine kinase [Rheinheimera sp.]|nr:HAMP domain-containing sensor histidine kinase [Rheinheimera sp.]
MDLEADVQLNSIPGLFNQLVCALLNNVIQHAYPSGIGGNCCLKLQSVGDELLLSCIDNGIGISQEQQKHVFDPFFTTKLGSGTSGLGLAIVYRIVRSNLGGSISVKSQLKEGTCFEIRFPRNLLP